MKISTAVNEYSLKYSSFMHGLKLQNIDLNRKMLATLAETEPLTFKSIVEHLKEHEKITDATINTRERTVLDAFVHTNVYKAPIVDYKKAMQIQFKDYMHENMGRIRSFERASQSDATTPSS